LKGRELSATADVVTTFDIKVGHSNYANTRTVLASPAFSIAPDPGIPNGAFIGTLTTQATLSLLGAACVSSVPVQIPLFDATTNITNTIDWTGDGSNLTVDSDGNGLADGIDKYPSFLNVMFYNQKPVARYYGYTVATGATPTQLNFVIFAPGVLAGTASAPGMPKPDQEMNASLGFINYVALNNPAPGQPAAPITITDICTPLNVTTRLLGKTAGEGRSIAPVGPPELSAQCTGALLGKDSDNDGDGKEGGGSVAGEDCDDSQDDDGDTKIDCDDFDCKPYCDDGCIVVTDKCGDGIDNDFDTKTDEYCVGATGLYTARTRSTNPSLATSGIYGSGTQLAGAYLQGGRDADSDGLENALDSCPTIADGRESGAACAAGNLADDDLDGKVNDGCPRVGTAESFPTPDQCSDAADQDLDGFINDGCPVIQKDSTSDGLGDACDPGVLAESGAQCNNATDDDGDTLVNDGCPAVGPAEAGAQCSNATDDDSDTVVNDGCPTVGTEGDQDGDTFTNRQDNCPLVANANQLDLDSDRCGDALNSDGADDTNVNDGCPQVGAAKETACGDALDNDSDGKVNDGCPLKGGISEFCAVSNGDFGPCSDSIGDACEVGADITSVNGDYDKDFPRVAVCIGAADADGDGWCDATETLLGSNPALGPVACTDAVDSDGDTNVNDGCPTVGGNPEDPSCVNAIDDDPADDPVDTVNDGCPAKDAAEVACADAVDDDADTRVNDGCPTVGSNPENPACANAIDDDAADDPVDTVNDGCPAKGVAENSNTPEYTGLDYPIDPAPQTCTNLAWYASAGDPIGDGAPIDDDGDTLVNAVDAGCAALALDDDQDGVPNASDNCPSVSNDQTNSDTKAVGGGDALGDACDPNDDNDGLIDILEAPWGSDTTHPFSPFRLDIDGSGLVQGADASALKAWIGTAVGSLRDPSPVWAPAGAMLCLE
jgi:hypothetical protein